MTRPPKHPGMSRREWLAAGALFVVLGSFFYALMLPMFQQVRSGPRRPQCRNNLHVIGLALHNYHDAYGAFPPAFVADADGRPMHSWRVLLLPWLDQAPLYEQYRFDEPWDGSHNRRLAERMPDAFRCPDDERLTADGHVLTAYCAVSQTGAAFDGSRPVNRDDFRDGISNTILIVESPGPPVHWMQPDDLSPQELQRRLSAKSGDVPHTGGVHVLFADGRVTYLPENIPPATLRALCTRSGGEAVEEF